MSNTPSVTPPHEPSPLEKAQLVAGAIDLSPVENAVDGNKTQMIARLEKQNNALLRLEGRDVRPGDTSNEASNSRVLVGEVKKGYEQYRADGLAANKEENPDVRAQKLQEAGMGLNASLSLGIPDGAKITRISEDDKGGLRVDFTRPSANPRTLGEVSAEWKYIQ